MQTSVLNHFTTSPEVAAPRGFEPRFTDPKSAVLPLDEGAAVGVLERLRAYPGQENGAEDGTRTRDPHLGKVMLYQLSHFRSMTRPPCGGAESQDRTGDTAIFSRVLYQLSYLGPMANQARSPVGGAENTTGLERPSNPRRRERGISVARARTSMIDPIDRIRHGRARWVRHPGNACRGAHAVTLTGRQFDECR